MAITASYGYDGTVDEVAWSGIAVHAAGHVRGVTTLAAWKVTATGTNRDISFAAGTGYSKGVIDVATATTLSLPTVATGVKWYMPVARRTWATNTTVFTYIEGGATAYLPARNDTEGTVDDQPLALVQITANGSGGTITSIIDLRTWNGDGGSYAANALATGAFSTIGTRLRIGGDVWQLGINSSGLAEWYVQRLVGQRSWWIQRGIAPGRDYDTYPSGALRTNLVAGTLTGMPAGWYSVTPHLELSNAAAGIANGSMYMEGHLGNFAARADVTYGLVTSFNPPWAGYFAGGAMYLVVGHQLNSGIGYIINAYSGIRVNYLGA